MRKALVVGVNYYSNFSSLSGCVNDANSVKAKLERNGDGTVNFQVKLLQSTGPTEIVSRPILRNSIEELFSGDGEIALLYFSGHGYIETAGGYLCASDCERGDDGVAISNILTWANGATMIQNRIVILDCCHSGIAGSRPLQNDASEIYEGVTILTASTSEQYASEVNGSGVFTSLLVDALAGSASNLVGDITPGSVYAHVDQSLGPWAQRPMFKTNVKRFISLRKVTPPIGLEDLRRLVEFFPEPGYRFQLDPTYEPERSSDDKKKNVPQPIPEHTEIFAILQSYNRLNLLVPVDAPHMWHAAMNSKTVKLTALGEHYRRLVEEKLI
ncbi:MAG: caspase family protein [Candidatus Krumholzibacteriota bacterium]|nr:caspase family protein [Candidatus Krumholzibacteriota bacterium]